MGTHYKGTKREVIALDTFIKITRASETISSKLKLSLDTFGLSEGQFLVMDALYHLGKLSQKQLGTKLLRSGGNITMVIDNLEKSGYAQRKRGKKDRRFFIIELTTKGKKKFEETFPTQVELITELMNILTKGEQKNLQALCKMLGKAN